VATQANALSGFDSRAIPEARSPLYIYGGAGAIGHRSEVSLDLGQSSP
jgi:hypothetical protein